LTTDKIIFRLLLGKGAQMRFLAIFRFLYQDVQKNSEIFLVKVHK